MTTHLCYDEWKPQPSPSDPLVGLVPERWLEAFGGEVSMLNRSRWTAGMALSLVLAFWVLQPGPGSEPAAVPTPRQEIVDLLGGVRLSEARLSGLPHAELASLNRLHLGPSPLEIRRSLATGRVFLSRADEALLAWLDGDLDGAIVRLERAVAAGKADPDLYTDLSAAHAEKARREDRPTAWIAALAAADRAVDLDPERPEAIFNLALALERLSARNEARAFWARYLELDPASPWSEEARQHLQSLAQPAGDAWNDHQRQELDQAAASGDLPTLHIRIEKYPQQVREHVEEDLLRAWSELWLQHQTAEAERALASASSVGNALAQSGRGRMAKDAAEAIARALADPQGRDRAAALAEGHLSYAEGQRLHDAIEFERAHQSFSQAVDLLRNGGSPFAAWARMGVAACDLQLGRYDQALSILKALRRDLREADHPSLFARSEWIEGIIRARQADPVAALELFQQALSRFAELGEACNTAALHELAAEAYIFLGDLDSAWASLAPALQAAPYLRNPRRAQAIFGGGAQVLTQQGAPELGIYFESEALAYAREAGSAAQEVVALVSRARMKNAAARWQEGLDDLKEAWVSIAGVANESLLSDIELAEGELIRHSDPAAAAKRLTKTLESQLRLRPGDRLESDRIYLARALAYLDLDDQEAAEADLQAGIAEFEHQRDLLLEESSKIMRQERGQELFDRMLDLQVRADRPVSTLFATAEGSRARVLLDLLAQAPQVSSLSTVSARPATLAEVQEALPAGTVLVEYALTGDLLIAWIVSAERTEMVHHTIDAKALESATGRFARLLQSGRSRAEALRLAAELYDELIAPVEPWLAAQSTLVIVPDKFLAQVPFAALLSRQSGRFLMEDHPLAFAPSATLYLRSLRRDCDLISGTARPLVVGNPAFDRTAMSSALVDLPRAEVEARRVAEILSGAELLIRAEATKRRFLARAPQASSIHLAAHGIPDPQYPLLSRFLLARDPDSDDPGALYAHEIYRLRFRATRLVFLSSCAAAAGPVLGREGSLSLVRPFLATGVPAVVGSLWSVPDKAPVDLVVRFYSLLESGTDPVRALRAAQIEQIRAKPPGTAAAWNWAAFQLHGGACA